ncbi:hypothetical protein P8452_28040 [Trifolium repens]|nr:hypothetical protein P8452_28040 [Trifolium repens]
MEGENFSKSKFPVIVHILVKEDIHEIRSPNMFHVSKTALFHGAIKDKTIHTNYNSALTRHQQLKTADLSRSGRSSNLGSATPRATGEQGSEQQQQRQRESNEKFN